MDAMKVGIIAAEMEGRSTGVGRYLTGLLQGFEAWDHGSELHLFFQGDPAEIAGIQNDFVVPHFSENHGRVVWWEQAHLSRELRRIELDLLFGPAYALPWRVSSKSAVTIHDLSFEVLPWEFGFKQRWRRRLIARRSCRRADRILTDTRAMADLVAERYELEAHRIGVVPLGIDTQGFSPVPASDDRQILSKLGIEPPYILWVGTVFERRLPSLVLDAFAALRSTWPDLTLVIAGANRLRRPALLGELIDATELQGAVVLPGWVEEEHLAPLYRGAELGIYISRHEGFGIPPLECLACGTPVVVSSGLGLEDAWPDYPYRCQELRFTEVAATMDSILANKPAAGVVMERAPEVLAGMSWEASARKLMSELEGIVAP